MTDHLNVLQEGALSATPVEVPAISLLARGATQGARLSARGIPRYLTMMLLRTCLTPLTLAVLSLVRELVQAAIDPARKPTRIRVRTRRALLNTVCLRPQGSWPRP